MYKTGLKSTTHYMEKLTSKSFPWCHKDILSTHCLIGRKLSASMNFAVPISNPYSTCQIPRSDYASVGFNKQSHWLIPPASLPLSAFPNGGKTSIEYDSNTEKWRSDEFLFSFPWQIKSKMNDFTE